MRERPAIPSSLLSEYIVSTRKRISDTDNRNTPNRQNVRIWFDLPIANPTIKGRSATEHKPSGNQYLGMFGVGDEERRRELEEQRILNLDRRKRVAVRDSIADGLIAAGLGGYGVYELFQDKEWYTAAFAILMLAYTRLAIINYKDYKDYKRDSEELKNKS